MGNKKYGRGMLISNESVSKTGISKMGHTYFEITNFPQNSI
jgi:hypothetical protein